MEAGQVALHTTPTPALSRCTPTKRRARNEQRSAKRGPSRHRFFSCFEAGRPQAGRLSLAPSCAGARDGALSQAPRKAGSQFRSLHLGGPQGLVEFSWSHRLALTLAQRAVAGGHPGTPPQTLRNMDAAPLRSALRVWRGRIFTRRQPPLPGGRRPGGCREWPFAGGHAFRPDRSRCARADSRNYPRRRCRASTMHARK
jgi:hypothetical protein